MEKWKSYTSRGQRTLRPLRNFQSSDEAIENLPTEVQSDFAPDEELLGIYRNSDSNPHANLVFTTRGIYHFAENWLCIEYSQIFRMHVFEDKHFDPQTADTLLFRMRDDQLIKLTISGTVIKMLSGYERRFPDLWEVDRFLIRVFGRTRCDKNQ